MDLQTGLTSAHTETQHKSCVMCFQDAHAMIQIYDNCADNCAETSFSVENMAILGCATA